MIIANKVIVFLAALMLLLTVHQSGEIHGAALQGVAGGPAPVKSGHEGNVSSQYHFDVWTTDNGLPQNSVTSILQTRDGYLWITTFDGLVRYDGVHFTIYNAGNTKGLKSSRFSQLYEDRTGNLWIITEDFGLIRYRDGVFRTLTTEDGLPNNRVLSMRSDAESVLFATAQGLAWWKDGSLVLEDPLPGRPFPDFGFPVRSGAVWHLDQSGLHRVENGRVTAHAPVSGLTLRDIKSLHEIRNGDLWVGVTDGVLMRFKDGKFTYYSRKDGLTGERINCIREDRMGNVWLGIGYSGLFRFKDDKFTRYTKADGLTGNDILSIYEDREGILWIGATAGLNRLRDNIITSYSAEDGLSGNNTYPICQDREGTIWIGTWTGLTRYRDGVFTRCGEQYGAANALVTALMTDREGGMWIGSLGGGAQRFENAKVTSYRVKDGLPSDVVRVIFEDREGT
ncbi:MAG TPA: two-component regulator propeller domain-containing protein, partial [Nitrospiraceae bacterium]|nr:two-component regulator propeller domain-containing protein [Nitrospiraceae bacterium]